MPPGFLESSKRPLEALHRAARGAQRRRASGKPQVRGTRGLAGHEARAASWSAEEQVLLERCLDAALPRKVIARIVERSVEELEERILSLGNAGRGGSWTRAETLLFKRIHGTHTDEDLARLFGRSLEEVRAFAHGLGLSKDKAFLRKLWGKGASLMPRWSEDEIARLCSLYPTRSNRELARELGRSVASVVSKANALGLRKSAQRLRRMGQENVSVRYSPA